MKPDTASKIFPETAVPRGLFPREGYFKSVAIENFNSFGPDRQVVDFTLEDGRVSQWTILLGDNGTGKSTVLQVLAASEPVDLFKSTANPLHAPRAIADSSASYIRALKLRGSQAGISSRVYLDFINSSFLGRSAGASTQAYFALSRDDQAEWSGHWSHVPLCFGYGATRRLSSAKMLVSDDEDRPSQGLFFEDAKLRNPEEWLLRLDYSSAKESVIQTDQRTRLLQVLNLLQDLLPDVLSIRISTPDSDNPIPRAQFETPYGWVPLHNLGQGYRAVIAWVVDLVSRMVERYPDSEHPLAEPAVVLIDEIDMHLHPLWQRTLMERLSEQFPNTQFIATAHSPLIVQAAPNAKIVLLRRRDNVVIVDNDPGVIREWRVDQLLTSDLFGLSSARPPAIESLLVRRRELLASTEALSEQDRVQLASIDAELSLIPTGETAKDADLLSGLMKNAADILAKYKK